MARHELAPQVAVMVYLGQEDDEIADRTGLAMDTVRKWRGEQWFRDLVVEQSEDALDEMASLARRAVYKALDKDDVTTAKWFLERRDKKFFAPSKKVLIEGEVNHTHRALKNLSDAELAQIIAQNEPQPELEAEFDQFCLPSAPDSPSDEAEGIVDAEFEPT